jgi:inositol phosphorylceramide mannosyltransferase catalytic subunit
MYNENRWARVSRGARLASDILRYEIVYEYGGIYVDVDFEPLKSLEAILHGVQAFVAHESEPFICNGIFGAVPGHELTERLVVGLEESMVTFQNGTVNQQTGPYHMTRQVKAMREEGKTTMKNGFEAFAPHVFFPYAWYEKDPGAPYDPLAYAVHHFRSMQEIGQDAREGH